MCWSLCVKWFPFYHFSIVFAKWYIRIASNQLMTIHSEKLLQLMWTRSRSSTLESSVLKLLKGRTGEKNSWKCHWGLREDCQSQTGRSEGPHNRSEKSGWGWELEPVLHWEEEEKSLTAGAVWGGDCHEVDGQYGMKVSYQPLNTGARGFEDTGKWEGCQNVVEGIKQQRLSEALPNDWCFGGWLPGQEYCQGF